MRHKKLAILYSGGYQEAGDADSSASELAAVRLCTLPGSIVVKYKEKTELWPM